MCIAKASAALVVAACVLATTALAQKPTVGTSQNAKAAAKTSSPPQAADEQAIRTASDAFAKAYNAHDPKAIAALFAPDGELVDSEGNAESGRAAVERVFTAVFDEFPEAAMSIDVTSVRFPSTYLAVEDGLATVVLEPGGKAEPNRYTATHMKYQDGNWRFVAVRDLQSGAPSAAEELEQLAWMIGDWVDESPDSLNVTSFQWTDNHRYILGQFTIRVAGQPVMSGSQRIAWDPMAKTLRNWVFDSEGGFAAGVFARGQDRWMIKQSGVTRDGERVSATNTITRLSKDRFSWESRDRTQGGEPLPDVGPVTVVRKPPKPGN
jgi:uncharacterized protein (TIGR02246 family)